MINRYIKEKEKGVDDSRLIGCKTKE